MAFNRCCKAVLGSVLSSTQACGTGSRCCQGGFCATCSGVQCLRCQQTFPVCGSCSRSFEGGPRSPSWTCSDYASHPPSRPQQKLPPSRVPRLDLPFPRQHGLVGCAARLLCDHKKAPPLAAIRTQWPAHLSQHHPSRTRPHGLLRRRCRAPRLRLWCRELGGCSRAVVRLRRPARLLLRRRPAPELGGLRRCRATP